MWKWIIETIPVQFCSKLNCDKYCDSTVSKNFEEKTKLKLCNETSDLCLNVLKRDFETEMETKKRWEKNDGSSNTINNSTISIHISAYECTSKVPPAFDSFNDSGLKKEKFESIKNTKQICISSTFGIQNPFEFPRQQNNEVPRPKTFQFREPQQLLIPSAASNHSQIQQQRLLYSAVETVIAEPEMKTNGERPMAIGREAADLVFLEVHRYKNRFFVSVHKDSTIAEVKQMLNDVIDPEGKRMELFRQYGGQYEKHSKLNDKSQLTTCGFQPDNATPDRPAVVVLTFNDEDPLQVINKHRP
uniref:Ubiquitin-like domain-containing protein n=1 Tax=Panagrolaimus sp. PS1159 TaxID=55785 RepID=A0AC35FIX0_9BILA